MSLSSERLQFSRLDGSGELERLYKLCPDVAPVVVAMPYTATIKSAIPDKLFLLGPLTGKNGKLTIKHKWKHDISEDFLFSQLFKTCIVISPKKTFKCPVCKKEVFFGLYTQQEVFWVSYCHTCGVGFSKKVPLAYFNNPEFIAIFHRRRNLTDILTDLCVKTYFRQKVFFDAKKQHKQMPKIVMSRFMGEDCPSWF